MAYRRSPQAIVPLPQKLKTTQKINCENNRFSCSVLLSLLLLLLLLQLLCCSPLLICFACALCFSIHFSSSLLVLTSSLVFLLISPFLRSLPFRTSCWLPPVDRCCEVRATDGVRPTRIQHRTSVSVGYKTKKENFPYYRFVDFFFSLSAKKKISFPFPLFVTCKLNSVMRFSCSHVNDPMEYTSKKKIIAQPRRCNYMNVIINMTKYGNSISEMNFEIGIGLCWIFVIITVWMMRCEGSYPKTEKEKEKKKI